MLIEKERDIKVFNLHINFVVVLDFDFFLLIMLKRKYT